MKKDNTQIVPFTDLAAMTREVWPTLHGPYLEALLDAQYIGGPAVTTFEREWATVCRTEHAVGVANGTDALLLTLEALGVGPADEVILPTNTFIATAEAVVRAGAIPRFADVDPDTMLLTPQSVAEAITPASKGVNPVHLYGQMPDMTALCAQADQAGLFVLEDAAQAHGAAWEGRPAGSWGVAGCFSFYPGKNLGAFGDGGAVVTSDADLAQRVRTLANHGRAAGGAHYEHEAIGTNSRLDALQAIALTAKLARNEDWTERRRDLADLYRKFLSDAPLQLQGVHPAARHVYHLFVVRVPQRDLVRARLADHGVQTGIHYPLPCHQQPPLRRYADRSLPVAEAAAGQLISLPMFPHMSDEQVSRVCDALIDTLTGLPPEQAAPEATI